MRLLVLNWRDSAHPGSGGAEVWAHRISESWARLGHDVTLFASAVDGLPSEDETNGVHIVRRGNRLTVYREARKYWKQQEGRFDALIESVNTRPFMSPSFAGDTPRITMVHQLAREVWFHQTHSIVALAGRYVFEPLWLRRYRNEKVTTNGQSGAESFAAYGLRNVEVIPTGLETPEFEDLPAKESVPTVIFCGRLASNKRPGHALEAFRIVKQQMPEAQMWVVGRGEEEEKLKAMGVDGVHFLGHVSREEKFDLMARAHALVVTSVREGWGLVVTEAGAVGTASVGYNVAGLCDSISAANGILVEESPVTLGNELAARLHKWVSGYEVAPTAGGVLPWDEVADRVLQGTGVKLPQSGSKNAIDLRESKV